MIKKIKFRHAILMVPLLLSAFLTACASPRLLPITPSEGTLSPDRKIATLEKAELIVNASHTRTPYGLRRITTFRVTLVNPTDHELDFYLKEVVLQDQNGRQFFALRGAALSEAAYAGSYGGSVGFGFGYGYHPTFVSPGYLGFYEPYPPRSYQGLLAQALPMEPITIYPHASVSGNVYFPVSTEELASVRLTLARFADPPRDPDHFPKEIVYTYEFRVLQ